MALVGKGTRITMDYGDYGIQLPYDISDLEYETGDIMRFILKKSETSEPILIKDFPNESTTEGLFRFFLEFSEKESNNLFPGNYVYYIKHIRDGEVRDTIVSAEDFKIKK